MVIQFKGREPKGNCAKERTIIKSPGKILLLEASLFAVFTKYHWGN